MPFSFVLIIWALALFFPKPESLAQPTLAEGFAVVELFTSQGCSSCPPADRLLSKLLKEEASSDRQVYFLSFHVDYWNYIGWKDPFSSRMYTERQYAYSRAFEQGSVYTPQMVVNGKTFFVGSSEAEARNAIKTALSQGAATRLELGEVSTTLTKTECSFTLGQALEDAQLVAVVVEKNISTPVSRGENSGRTLAHDQVVRAYQVQDLGKLNQGKVSLSLPEGLKPEQAEIIAFVQKKGSREIMAAAKRPLH